MAVRGTVVSFDRIKGYGFVAAESGGEDVFLHVNDLLDDKSLLSAGSVVEFVIEEGDRGPKASAVSIVQPAPSHGSGQRRTPDPDGDDMCDVLTNAAFEREITETLLRANPPLTGAQILDLRNRIATVAQDHGWVDR
ncbi:MAG: cold shock domain-containing protein [Catenulispora sp.]|nr:cold shock domain-containing protein [Catenulispora sp.]